MEGAHSVKCNICTLTVCCSVCVVGEYVVVSMSSRAPM